MSRQPNIVVTQQDAERLRALLDDVPDSQSIAADALDFELARAKVVPRSEMAPDTVTMNSRVCFEDVETSERREVTLVYPKDANVAAGKVSVLAPVGSALLGLRVGQTIDWPTPGGRTRRLRIVDVPFQPEAAGEE